jgi:hypothetical protein
MAALRFEPDVRSPILGATVAAEDDLRADGPLIGELRLSHGAGFGKASLVADLGRLALRYAATARRAGAGAGSSRARRFWTRSATK